MVRHYIKINLRGDSTLLESFLSCIIEIHSKGKENSKPKEL